MKDSSTHMLQSIRARFRALLSYDSETPRIVNYVRACISQHLAARIVDVGCGHGRTLRALHACGIEALGVDINPEIVEQNVREGLRCTTPNEFLRRDSSADVMIMSHIVEHFPPDELVQFMDKYLDHLRAGGHLVVATPLLHPRFYDDFDHIKPYHPLGFKMVFGAGSAQVQYYARNRLELVDLWFRRSPLAATFVRGAQVKSWSTRVWQVVNLFGVMMFLLSRGMIGRATGWVGVFRKSGSSQTD